MIKRLDSAHNHLYWKWVAIDGLTREQADKRMDELIMYEKEKKASPSPISAPKTAIPKDTQESK